MSLQIFQQKEEMCRKFYEEDLSFSSDSVSSPNLISKNYPFSEKLQSIIFWPVFYSTAFLPFFFFSWFRWGTLLGFIFWTVATYYDLVIRMEIKDMKRMIAERGAKEMKQN
tara:strand:+ start:548 stop:880 length:333 start_codon:yes stop_codon:yes gene_type:complete